MGIIHFNNPSREEYPVVGVDVSKYQGAIDWNQLIEQDISFAYIKATEGSSHVDEYYDANFNNALKTGIRVGAYHFFSFESSGKKQAETYCKNVSITEGMLPPVIDVEYYGDKKGVDDIDVDAVRKNLREMVDILEEEYGLKPVLYVTKNSYDTIVSGYFDDCDLWYRSVYSKVPKDVKWTFWQYSNRTVLNGYEGEERYIDVNVFNGTREEFEELGVGTNVHDLNGSSVETKEIESLWSKESASESRVKLESKLVDGEIELIIPQYNGSSDQRVEYLIDGEKNCDFNFKFPEQITEIETCDYNFDGNVDIVFVGYNHGKKDFWLYRSRVREYEEDTCYFVNDDDIESYVEKELSDDYSAEDIINALTNGLVNGEISSYSDAYKAIVAFNQIENESLDLKYSLVYIDEDDIPELLVDDTGYWISVYSFSNSTVTEPMEFCGYGLGGCLNYEYVPYKNSLRYFGHDMETYGYTLMKIENNKLVVTYSEDCYYEEETVNYNNYTDEQLSPEELKNRVEEYNSCAFEELYGEYTEEEIIECLYRISISSKQYG